MRHVVLLLAALLLASCRGEPVPRDYQNAPPAMTHPPLTKAQTPTQNGMPGPAPQPSSGVEGKNITGEPTKSLAPTETLKDQSPVTGTTGS